MSNTHFNHPEVDYDDHCVACLQARVAELEATLKTVRMCESIKDARIVVDEILQA